MRLSKHTSGFHRRTTGRSCGRTSLNTPKPAYGVNNEKNRLTNLRHYIHYQIRKDQMSEFTQTFSDQCWRRVASTNTSCASQMLLQNTRWSRQSRTRRLRRWPRPSSTNGFANSASRRKSTLTAGRSLLTSSLTSYSSYLMFSILKQLRPIPSVTPRLKFSTKP